MSGETLNKVAECVVQVHDPSTLASRFPVWEAWLAERGADSLSSQPRWLHALREGLGHTPYCLEAIADNRVVGLLPLAFVQSRLFGRFLVGLPYLNTGGVMADDLCVGAYLVDQAVELADKLKVKHLELRHEVEVTHQKLNHSVTSKVHMRLPLPATTEELWKSFKASVRNQIRKGEKHELAVQWGGEELLADFYVVFSRNMRDLGTPVFGRRLFQSILRQFADQSELCLVYANRRPIAAALLCHGSGVTEVLSASSLREFNSTNANMYMYWQLLQRAVERGQRVFDFGRSTIDSNTFRFKKQWGAEAFPAVWQYYSRHGDVGEMRPKNKKYQLAIRVWQRLPVAVANALGPVIVRGIP